MHAYVFYFDCDLCHEQPQINGRRALAGVSRTVQYISREHNQLPNDLILLKAEGVAVLFLSSCPCSPLRQISAKSFNQLFWSLASFRQILEPRQLGRRSTFLVAFAVFKYTPLSLLPTFMDFQLYTCPISEYKHFFSL